MASALGRDRGGETFALPEVLGLDVPLDADDGAQDLAAARPQALVHHLHRVLAERQPVSPPARWQHPLHGTPAQLKPPHRCWDTPPMAAVPFSCAEQVRRGERGRSRSRSRHLPGGSSGPRWSTWGCQQGGGAKGWRCRCPRSSARWWCCCRCPRRHRSPSRDRTLPVRLRGGHTCCHCQLRANRTPPGQRPALRLDNPQQQFASVYLFFKKLGKVKPLHLYSAPAPNYWSFIPFFPLLVLPGIGAIPRAHRHSRHTVSSQHRGTHISHGSGWLFLSLRLHLTPRE